MTTPRAVATQLRNLLSLLIQSDISLVINPVIEQRVASATRVTWSSPVGTSGIITAAEFATIEEYSNYVDSQTYSTVLYDGSLLQISYDFQRDDLVGHRLCYYPCPFDMDQELLRTEPIGELIDLYRDNVGTTINLRSPCRFDYDRTYSGGAHPRVHMHVIRPHCRWPVSRPLSIGHFIGFVFRHFYPNIWAVHPFLRKWPCDNPGLRTITLEEEKHLHVSCGR
jgi:hypothetical protein